jgi:O-antigen/teichoic acid export membrane protein
VSAESKPAAGGQATQPAESQPAAGDQGADRWLPSREAIALIGLALLSFVLKYLTSMVLANALGIDGYDHYAVAIASVLFCSTLVELGLGKQGIRLLPHYIASGQFELAAGYWRFAMRTVLGLAVVIGLLASLQDEIWPQLALASDEAMYLLPLVALTGIGAELLLATGAALLATIVVRVLIPGILLGFVVWASHSPLAATLLRPGPVIVVFGIGWLAGLLVLMRGFVVRCPEPVLRGPSQFDGRVWLRGGLGFLGVSAAISALLEGTVALTELVGVPSADISIYAVCIETGGFVLVLVKSLDKFYLQRISALIAEAKLEEIHRIRRRRAVLTLSVCVSFCAGIVLVGRPLLASFGPGFERGYPALCLVAVATSAWTLTSLSQWLIAFIDGPGAALRITLGGVLATYTAIIVLGPSWGLMGIALAYAVMVTVMAALLELRARAILRRLGPEVRAS